MTELQYQTKLFTLKTLFEAQVGALKKQFAEANNPFKIGDTIKSKYGEQIVIESMSVITWNDMPGMRYSGHIHFHDGRARLVHIHQSDAIKVK